MPLTLEEYKAQQKTWKRKRKVSLELGIMNSVDDELEAVLVDLEIAARYGDPDVRACRWCLGELPDSAVVQTKYCSPACAKAANQHRGELWKIRAARRYEAYLAAGLPATKPAFMLTRQQRNPGRRRLA